MAKNAFPMMQTSGGSGLLSKVVRTLVVVAAVVLVVKFPNDAAALVQTVVLTLTSVVDGLANFFREVAK